MPDATAEKSRASATRLRMKPVPLWSVLLPIGCWLLLAGSAFGMRGPAYALSLGMALVAGVMVAVHHAEVVAHRVGEPFGTLVLGLAVTFIEVALIVSLMTSGGAAASVLVRDTVFATIMIALNGVLGLCLLVGGRHFREQSFGLYGVSASLATLATIAVLTLVLPNYTTTIPGPFYSGGQLGFVAVVSLTLFGTFIFVQTIRHRDYFLPAADAVPEHESHAEPPSGPIALLSGALLVVTLVAVVISAEALAPSVEAVVHAAGAPQALVSIIVASVVLLPEGYAAVRAARRNRLQTSLNLTLGSALSSIGFTIPAIAFISLFAGWDLKLGLEAKETLLLILTLFIASLSLNTGRTTVLQGAVHLVLFAVYLCMVIAP